MKKILSLVAIALIGLSGCSSSDSGSSSDLVTLEEPVTITFWHAMNGVQEDTLTELTDEFNAQSEYVTVELVNQSSYSTLQEKLNAAATSDTLPTISQAYPDWIFALNDDGVVQDLTSYYDDSEQGVAVDNYVDAFIDEVTTDDQVLAMPFNKSTEVMYYNKDLLEEAGVDVPTDFDELREAGQQIYDETGVVGYGYDSLPNFFNIAVVDCGASYVNEDNEVQLDDACISDRVAAYQSDIDSGAGRVAGEDGYLSGPFGNGDVAIYIGSTAGITFVEEGIQDKFELGIAAYPGDASPQQGTSIAMFNNATPEEKTGAWEYMKYLTNDENTEYWAEQTGYLPVTKAAYESDEYIAFSEENEIGQVTTDQMPTFTVIYPDFAGASSVNTLVSDYMSSTLEAGNDAATELTELTEEAQAVVDRNN